MLDTCIVWGCLNRLPAPSCLWFLCERDISFAVVIATDGLWDELTNNEVLDILRRMAERRSGNPLHQLKRLVCGLIHIQSLPYEMGFTSSSSAGISRDWSEGEAQVKEF